MSHFAEIDENDVVLGRGCGADKSTQDADGVEREEIGVAYLQKLFGGNWVQTSYTGKIRKCYAGIGVKYRRDLDAFEPPNDYPSWRLNEELWQWEPPVPMPASVGPWEWNEETLSWETD